MESAKERVTTHLPNELALKMDGTQVCYPHLPVSVQVTRQRVGRCGGREEDLAAMLGGTASSADLGGSSKYSSEILED